MVTEGQERIADAPAGDDDHRIASRILDDERRRSGQFLRDFLVRHRVDLPVGGSQPHD